MKLSKLLLAYAIVIGLISGFWQLLVLLYPTWVPSFPLDKIGIAGFFGWATFYAAGGKTPGLVKGLGSNLSGVFWGISMVFIASWFSFSNLGFFIGVTIGAFLICFQAHFKLLSFIPGAFIGSATFFAMGGTIDIPTISSAVIGLSIGLIVLGLGSEVLSLKLKDLLEKKKAK
jgi:hypothetical protein